MKRLNIKLCHRIQKKTVKRIALIALCTLIAILPTIMAISYVRQNKNSKKQNDFSVTLFTADGVCIAEASGNPEDADSGSLVDIFYKISSQKLSPSQIPELQKNNKFILAKISSKGISYDLKCYFFTDSSVSCYVDNTGKIYTIPSIYAEEFLASPYAEFIYDTAAIPKLRSIDNDIIIPAAVNWQYKNASNQFHAASSNATTSELRFYEMTEGIGLSFEKEPDLCSIQVYEGDRLIYDGAPSNLSTITVDYGNILNIKVHAIWNKKDNVDYYGDAYYDFQVHIRNHSVFTVSHTTISPGEFLVLSCTNISDPSKIVFSSNFPNLIPTFHKDGEYFRSIIAFPSDTVADTFTFNISYAASSQNFSIDILPSEKASMTHSLPSLPISSALTNGAKKEFNSLLRSVQSLGATSVYFRGNFLNPTDLGFSIGYRHNDQLLLKEDLSLSYITCGTEFLTPDDTEMRVSALNNGIVIRTGTCDFLGNYLVVDHGCGLRSWYAHLSSITSKTGDIVLQGETVGFTGQGGIASGNGFLLICTVYETLIDPDFILENSFVR